jgi:hypothetical protein
MFSHFGRQARDYTEEPVDDGVHGEPGMHCLQASGVIRADRTNRDILAIA